MNKLKYIVVFIVGAAAGSVATWALTKTKYEKIAQEEIDSVKEVYSHRTAELSAEAQKCKDLGEKFLNGIKSDAEAEAVKKNAEAAREKPNILEYTEMIKKNGYTKYSNVEPTPDGDEDIPFMRPDTPADTEDKETSDEPYVISPDEFDEFDDYRTISLVYYADNILADDDNDLIDDADKLIGLSSLNTFGEYEDDAVFVRNDRIKCDFEILRDLRNYSDVVKSMPHYTED